MRTRDLSPEKMLTRSIARWLSYTGTQKNEASGCAVPMAGSKFRMQPVTISIFILIFVHARRASSFKNIFLNNEYLNKQYWAAKRGILWIP